MQIEKAKSSEIRRWSKSSVYQSSSLLSSLLFSHTTTDSQIVWCYLSIVSRLKVCSLKWLETRRSKVKKRQLCVCECSTCARQHLASTVGNKSSRLACAKLAEFLLMLLSLLLLLVLLEIRHKTSQVGLVTGINATSLHLLFSFSLFPANDSSSSSRYFCFAFAQSPIEIMCSRQAKL